MKKRRKSGFTLAEVLIATAILAIFVSMAIVGTSALFGTGEQMMTVSKAAVLGSDLMKAVTNEVRFGENFTLEEGTNTLKYNSTTYGEGCEFKVGDDGMLTIVQTSNSMNAFGETKSDSKEFFPIGSAAYDEVRIKDITFAISTENKQKQQFITCTLSLTMNGSDSVWEKSVTIVPLYQKTVIKS